MALRWGAVIGLFAAEKQQTIARCGMTRPQRFPRKVLSLSRNKRAGFGFKIINSSRRVVRSPDGG
jgi:hypothetical protein